MNIYVSNLGEKITDESLGVIFATHGKVSSSKIIKDRFTGSSKGFAFVEMPDNVEAETALIKIDGTIIDGRSISARKAKPGPQENSPIDKIRNR